MAKFDHHSSHDSPVPSFCDEIHREAVQCYYGAVLCGGPTNVGYLLHFPSSPGLRPTQKSRPCTPKSVYTVLGIEHKYIDSHGESGCNMKTLTGQLRKGNLEALQLELEVGTPVSVTDFRRYGTLATASSTQHTWFVVALLQGASHRGSRGRPFHFGDDNETNT
jgi:hypothetical protein